MTKILIPTRGRPDLLARCLDSLVITGAADRTIVIVDDDLETWELPEDRWPDVNFLLSDQRRGFWQCLNLALQYVSDFEPFCYFGKDVMFAPDWLETSERCWRQRFPNGLGLMTFRDGVQDGTNASHGMTTRRWLYVLNGQPFFPTEYWHHFCDSEMTVRSRDFFRRYYYCKEAVAWHRHEPTGHDNSGGHDDQAVQARRHQEWEQEGGSTAARLRFMELVA